MKTNRIVSLILTLAVLLTMAFPISVAAEDVEIFDENSYAEEIVVDEQPAEEVLYVEGEEPAAEPAEPAEPESEDDVELEDAELEDAEQEEASLTDSETEIFEAGAPAVIVAQPENAFGGVGDTVSFTVEAENAKAYVWQYSKDKGNTWTSWKADEYKQATLTLKLTNGRLAMQYRCKITGQDGKAIYSDAVCVSEAAAAKITQQPENATGSVGDTVTFTVKAENAKAYVWQYSKDKGKTWTSWKADEYKQAALTLKLTSSRMAMKYRCEVTGENGKAVYSEAVGVIAGAAAKITKQPVDAFGSVGDTVTFTVKAENAAGYVWQYSKDNGKTWTSWKSDEYKQATLKLSLTSSRMTMKYRCEVTGENGKAVYSDAVGVESVLEYNGVLFKLNVDGTLTVTGYIGSSANVVVPETVNGHTVTVIGECAFENKTFIVSVKLPGTITVIMRRAFAGCTSLREMS